MLSLKRVKMLYSRCSNDPSKCGDLVLDRVLSSRYKWGTTVKVFMSGVTKVQCPTPIEREDEIVCFSILQMQGPSSSRSFLHQVHNGLQL